MPSFSAQNCTFNFQNAPKCPVFDTRLRNFTERILTSTLCKILLPHASICTIKRKLRNFTEFCQSRFFHTQTTYGSYGWLQLSFNFHPAAFLFQKTHRLVKKVQTLYSCHQHQHHAPIRSHNLKLSATYNILTINNLRLTL